MLEDGGGSAASYDGGSAGPGPNASCSVAVQNEPATLMAAPSPKPLGCIATRRSVFV